MDLQTMLDNITKISNKELMEWLDSCEKYELGAICQTAIKDELKRRLNIF